MWQVRCEEIPANDICAHVAYACSAILWLKAASAQHGVKKIFIINKLKNRFYETES
jgi:hypothetical protein